MNDNQLKETLALIIPEGLEIASFESCSEFLGPAVVLFSLSPTRSPKTSEDTKRGYLWRQANSLREFAESDSAYTGAGISATLLDGKDCLQKMTDDADTILFGTMPGKYFHSETRDIVAVIFDVPNDHGVMFIQAP